MKLFLWFRLSVVIHIFLLIMIFSCTSVERGCTSPGAANFDHEAAVDDGSCLWQRTFWSDFNDTLKTAWIDVWVTKYDSLGAILVYEGRITEFYPDYTPNCENSSGLIHVLRKPGEYYYEIENDRGELFNGWVIFRLNDICRLNIVKYKDK